MGDVRGCRKRKKGRKEIWERKEMLWLIVKIRG